MSLPAIGTEKTGGISPRRKFEGHTAQVDGVIHLLGEQRIMTCSLDGSLRMWNLKSGEQIGKDWRDGESGPNAIVLSPDGKELLSGNKDGALRVWDVDTGKVITKWIGHTGAVISVRWNRDGGRVLSGSEDGTARVWDVESGETILAIKTGFAVYSAIYSPNETMIATGGASDDIKIFDTKTGKLVANLEGHTDMNHMIVNCLAWTPDATTLISGSSDASIRTCNTTTWQQTTHLFTGHNNVIWDIAISPNGRILASASWDKTARLWNLANGQPIASPLQHARYLHCVSFSTDGKLLATGCCDNNAYTWDIPTILIEAGLDELLLNPNSSLEADATRRPAQRRRRDNIDPHRPLPPGFFDDSPRHPPASRTRPRSTSSAREHHVARHLSSDRHVLGRLSSLFRPHNYNTRHVPPRTRLLERVPIPFSRTPRRRHDEGIELQERHPTVVDVPLARGKPRNYTARELLMKRKREREKAMAAKNASSGNSHPLQCSVVERSGRAAQAKRSSELHDAVATSSTTPAIASTSVVSPSTTSLPDAMTPCAGCWTRFRRFICCVSVQYNDGHN